MPETFNFINCRKRQNAAVVHQLSNIENVCINSNTLHSNNKLHIGTFIPLDTYIYIYALSFCLTEETNQKLYRHIQQLGTFEFSVCDTWQMVHLKQTFKGIQSLKSKGILCLCYLFRHILRNHTSHEIFELIPRHVQ